MKRIYQLDLFRFLAALSVMLYHYVWLAEFKFDLKGYYIGGFSEVFKYGYLGVDLFFVISGFVILLSIQNKNLLGFVRSRITRLYPAYWVGVILTSCFIYLGGQHLWEFNLNKSLVNLTMLSGPLGFGFVDEVYWTLLVELKFYFLIGIIILIRKWIKMDYILWVWLFLSLFSKILEVQSDIFILKIVSSVFITTWSGYFISGIVFYRIWKSGVSVQNLSLLIFSILLSLQTAYSKGIDMQGRFGEDVYSIYTILIIILSIHCAFFLVVTNRLKFINKKYFVKLGVLTYPLYLIHQNIGYIVLDYSIDFMEPRIALATLCVIMLIIAFMIHHKIEIPLSKKLNDILKTAFSRFEAMNFRGVRGRILIGKNK